MSGQDDSDEQTDDGGTGCEASGAGTVPGAADTEADPDRRTPAAGDGRVVAIPGEATDGEAAAIAAAVGAHLADLDRAAAETDEVERGDGWDGRRWAFAGRTDAVSDRPLRPTDGTPSDPWTAAGRADRL